MAKAGFATIIGRPNVGKSTLMNTLIGQKIAITSYKPQTTRKKIRTIYTDEKGQIVFLDTPGIHAAKDRLGEYMYKAAESTLKEVDVIVWIVEPKLPIKEADLAIMRTVSSVKRPLILVVGKADTVKKTEILPVIRAYAETWKKLTGEELSDIIPVSARTRVGVEDLMTLLYSKLPEGEPFYDEEMVTTETEREIATEIIREKALRLLQEEVPHGIAVQVNRMKSRTARSGEDICDIDADIICERDSHKSIIIGAKGSMLKKIGTAARTDIENMIQEKVNLKLFVKVRRDWKDDDNALKAYGYNAKDLNRN